MAVKLSISLSDEDLARLDAMIDEGIAPNRSRAVHLALAMMEEARRESVLERQFVAAMEEWRDDGDGWDAVVGDGL